MDDQSDREQRLFEVALRLSTDEARAAYLNEACANDSALRRKVEDLLLAHRQLGTFLERPAVADALRPEAAARTPLPAGSGTQLVRVTEKAGDKIGRYKLLQSIGEGGCGVVYMAEQEEPVRRRVALKIIKLGMDTKSVIARFEVERQALAMMDHPNIARVFDAGATETGRPYFVMELVRGIRITEYCDQNTLPTEDRLKLFNQVGRAIQHAHQKGVIHRDIKPSNILVTLHDGVPVPKVIDFGIAKATDQRLTDKTLFTEFQAFIGTPAYVSPEQAQMSGLDIDTRSDVYSLGVLLYELLTGRTPFDPEELMRSGLDEMRRTIREAEPLRPSTRLSALREAELTTTAKRQRAEPPKLISRIRGDLDWIVMKCLEKDRTRRYDTASSLVSDVECYLKNEPVQARPPSPAYKFQKLMRRNKVAFVGGAVAGLTLTAGLMTSTWLFFREREARKDAVAAQTEQSRLYGEAEEARTRESRERNRAESERRLALRTAYNSDMNLVHQAMAANNYGRVIDLLNRHRPGDGVNSGQLPVVSGQKLVASGRRPGITNRIDNSAPLTTDHRQLATDLRQWEWRYFWSQFRSDAAFALPRQSNAISLVAVSPDGRFLASSSEGRPPVLKLWDLFRRAEVASFDLAGVGPGSDPDRGPGRGPGREPGRGLAPVRSPRGAPGPGPGFGTSPFAFSHAGDRLAAVLMDGRRRTAVKVWSLPSGEIIAEIAGNNDVAALAFSSDGTNLLTFSDDMTVRAWDFEKRQSTLRTTVKLQEEGFRRRLSLFSPDAGRLAISDESGVIRILDLATGAETDTGVAFEDGGARSMAFSPDGEWIAATGFLTETSIKVFSAKTGALVFKLDGHTSWIPGTAFASDGKRLVSVGADQTVRIWDLDSRKERAALRGHLSEVNCVAMTPNGKTIVSGCKDGTLFGWDAQRAVEPKHSFRALPIPVAGIEFLPAQRGMLSVNADGTVSLWDPITLLESERIAALGDRVARLVVSPDGTRLYAGTDEGEIKVFDWAAHFVVTNWRGTTWRGLPPRPGFRGRDSAVGPVGQAEGGRILAVAGPGPTIRLLETESGQLKASWDLGEADGESPRGPKFPPREPRPSPKPDSPAPPSRPGAEFPPPGPKPAWKGSGRLPFFRPQMAPMMVTPDGYFLLVAEPDGSIDFRNLFTGRTEATLPGQNLGLLGMALSTDGSLLATASIEGTVSLWDSSTRSLDDVLRGHLLGVHAVAFSPDGQRLAMASTGSEAVKLWDVLTHQEVATLSGQDAVFGIVKFSPDGRLLVAVNRQGTAHIWLAPSLSEIEEKESLRSGAIP
ncbi:MAG: protein kinase [Verrucomicrobia bacterium]|nr:protein kinase [Verrucomicrobiota bacterium]